MLTQAFDWRWVLFVNVPIGIVLLIAAVRSLTESRGTLSGLRSLDLPGAITVTTGLAALVYAIVTTDTYSWGSAHTLVLLAVAAVLLVTFGIIESRVKHPSFPCGSLPAARCRGPMPSRCCSVPSSPPSSFSCRCSSSR